MPKYGKCLYEDKGYMAADKMAIDTTGYKEEASIKQIQTRNNALKYYNLFAMNTNYMKKFYLITSLSKRKMNIYLRNYFTIILWLIMEKVILAMMIWKK